MMREPANLQRLAIGLGQWMLAGAAMLAGACAGGGDDRAVVLAPEDFVNVAAAAPPSPDVGAEAPVEPREPELATADGPARADLPGPATHGAADVPAPEAAPAPAPLTTLGAGAGLAPAAIPAEAARLGIVDVAAAPGPPVVDEQARPVEPPTLVDAVVGDINGKPVRANEFLEPMAERLRRTAAEQGMTREAWTAFARQLIRSELFLLIRDELMKAEALASLKEQERLGLQYMLEEWRENLRRRSGGSRAMAEERLREQVGLTAHEFLKQREAAALIDHELQRTIHKRVQVSWQDIQLYYERNYERFNPPPTALFRLIRVPSADAEQVERVRSALERGEPFEEVASWPENLFAPEQGGAHRVAVPEGVDKAQVFGVAELNTAAQALEPGEWTREPIRVGSTLAWVYLESVQAARRSLEDRDVQLEILDALTSQRLQEEQTRYVNYLLERASVTDRREMEDRLVQIATERFWPGR